MELAHTVCLWVVISAGTLLIGGSILAFIRRLLWPTLIFPQRYNFVENDTKPKSPCPPFPYSPVTIQPTGDIPEDVESIVVPPLISGVSSQAQDAHIPLKKTKAWHCKHFKAYVTLSEIIDGQHRLKLHCPDCGTTIVRPGS